MFQKETNFSLSSLLFSEERLILQNFSRKVTAITRVFQHQRIVRCTRIFPGDYLTRSVKPRLHLFSNLICGKLEGGGFSIALFIFVPITVVFFAQPSRECPRRRRRGRVRQNGVINYRVSKPRRAFICTALALSLAPFLIRALVTSDMLPRDVAKSRDNFGILDKFAEKFVTLIQFLYIYYYF